jgi:glycosyltransferase involved in cell wall biosynthesis
MSKPLRLALIITELEVGGAENCLVNLAVGIDRTRFAPEVYSLGPRPVLGRDALVRRLKEANVPAHFLNIRSTWQFFSAESQLAKMLLAQQADIVQSFLFHANVVGTLAARTAKARAICLGVRVADPSRSRHWIERYVARRADRIVCVSQSVSDFCRNVARFPAGKLLAIPNGVELSRFAEAAPLEATELGIAPDRKVLLFVGRLEPQKGLDWLLPALPKLLDDLGTHDFLIVGDGGARDDLVKLAADSRIHFLRRREDVPRLLATADMLVLPSRYEGMPNVVLEAMAAGKPVVATRAEGIEELLGEAASSQTAEFGDLPGFLGRIRDLAGSPTLAAELGEANRQRAAETFSLASMIGSYEQMYAELASSFPRE